MTPAERERVLAEREVMRLLKHERIIELFASWVEPDRVVLITALCTSGDLQRYYRSHAVPLRCVKEWARQVLAGIAYLHALSPTPVVHRDLKCENLLYDATSNTVRIADFGLSTRVFNPRRIDEAATAEEKGAVEGTEEVAASGADAETALPAHQEQSQPQPPPAPVATFASSALCAALGTPNYMAPEMFEERGRYSETVDVYSFGMCVLELCSRRLPYDECGNSAQIYRKVTTGVLPEAFFRLKHPGVRDFVRFCIARRPDGSRPSAAEVLRHPFLNPAVGEAPPPEDEDTVLVYPEANAAADDEAEDAAEEGAEGRAVDEAVAGADLGADEAVPLSAFPASAAAASAAAASAASSDGASAASVAGTDSEVGDAASIMGAATAAGTLSLLGDNATLADGLLSPSPLSPSFGLGGPGATGAILRSTAPSRTASTNAPSPASFGPREGSTDGAADRGSAGGMTSAAAAAGEYAPFLRLASSSAAAAHAADHATEPAGTPPASGAAVSAVGRSPSGAGVASDSRRNSLESHGSRLSQRRSSLRRTITADVLPGISHYQGAMSLRTGERHAQQQRDRPHSQSPTDAGSRRNSGHVAEAGDAGAGSATPGASNTDRWEREEHLRSAQAAAAGAGAEDGALGHLHLHPSSSSGYHTPGHVIPRDFGVVSVVGNVVVDDHGMQAASDPAHSRPSAFPAVSPSSNGLGHSLSRRNSVQSTGTQSSARGGQRTHGATLSAMSFRRGSGATVPSIGSPDTAIEDDDTSAESGDTFLSSGGGANTLSPLMQVQASTDGSPTLPASRIRSRRSSLGPRQQTDDATPQQQQHQQVQGSETQEGGVRLEDGHSGGGSGNGGSGSETVRLRLAIDHESPSTGPTRAVLSFEVDPAALDLLGTADDVVCGLRDLHGLQLDEAAAPFFASLLSTQLYGVPVTLTVPAIPRWNITSLALWQPTLGEEEAEAELPPPFFPGLEQAQLRLETQAAAAQMEELVQQQDQVLFQLQQMQQQAQSEPERLQLRQQEESLRQQFQQQRLSGAFELQALGMGGAAGIQQQQSGMLAGRMDHGYLGGDAEDIGGYYPLPDGGAYTSAGYDSTDDMQNSMVETQPLLTVQGGQRLSLTQRRPKSDTRERLGVIDEMGMETLHGLGSSELPTRSGRPSAPELLLSPGGLGPMHSAGSGMHTFSLSTSSPMHNGLVSDTPRELGELFSPLGEPIVTSPMASSRTLLMGDMTARAAMGGGGGAGMQIQQQHAASMMEQRQQAQAMYGQQRHPAMSYFPVAAGGSAGSVAQQRFSKTSV
jgi:hypothetical protein